jgi:hypothetical protein
MNRTPLLGFLFFLDLNDFAAVIKATGGTHGVREAPGTAIGANDGIDCRHGVLRAAAVAAALGMFALGMWGHETFSFYIHQTGMRPVCMVTN